MTRGIRSSEFWLTALVIVAVSVLLAIGRLTPADLQDLWPLFVSAGAYALSRGVAKGGDKIRKEKEP